MKILLIISLAVPLAACTSGERDDPVSSSDPPSMTSSDRASRSDVTEEEVKAIARKAVEENDTWADRATWDVKRMNDGWSVIAWRIHGYDGEGNPQFTPGGNRLIEVDAHGKLTAYHRGR